MLKYIKYYLVLREIFNNILMCLFETNNICVRWEQFEIQMLFYFTHSFLTQIPKTLLSKTSVFLLEK